MITEIESLGSILHATLAVALILAAAYGAGRIVVPPSAGTLMGGVNTNVLRIAVGLNLVGLLGVALGAAGLLTGSRSIGLLALLALIPAIFTWRSWGGASATANWRSWPRPRSLWLVIPAGLLTLVTLGPALCYPTGWDELVYHHVLPRRWLADGWPAVYPDLPYSGFPSLGKILFWLMAPIESVIAPRLLSWTCWLIGLMFLYRLLRRVLTSMSAATLTVAFALSSTVLLISANCYVETILMMNFAAILLVIQRRRESSQEAAILGVLAGGAAAVKLTGIVILVVPCLWYACEAWRKRPHRLAIVQSLMLFLATTILIGLPFYIRPWLLTGNPVYPYYAQFFTVDPARLEMSRYHHALGAAFGIRSPIAFFFSPFLLAFDREIYDGDFGWQLITFIGLSALAVASVRGKRLRPVILVPTATTCVLYSFWFFTAQQARFAIPAMLALMQLAAFGLRRLHGTQRKLVLVAILAMAVFSVPWRNSGHYLGSWFTVLGFVSETDYVNVSTDSDHLPLAYAVAQHTPLDARLMLLFEHRGFYLPRSNMIGTPFFQEARFTPPEPFGDVSRIMGTLARDRITHVVTAIKPTGPDQPQEWLDRLTPFLAGIQQCVEQRKLRPIWQSDRYVLFELTNPIAPAPSESP